MTDYMSEEQRMGESSENSKNVKDISLLLSKHNTSLSFQRTRLSADRTLMSVIRTALSLIGFGFTIFQFFRSLSALGTQDVDPNMAARKVGLAMVGLGIGILATGIVYHSLFMIQVRRERQKLKDEGLIVENDRFPVSMTLIIATLLLLLGLYIIIKMVTQFST